METKGVSIVQWRICMLLMKGSRETLPLTRRKVTQKSYLQMGSEHLYMMEIIDCFWLQKCAWSTTTRICSWSPKKGKGININSQGLLSSRYYISVYCFWKKNWKLRTSKYTGNLTCCVCHRYKKPFDRAWSTNHIHSEIFFFIDFQYWKVVSVSRINGKKS